MTPCPKGDHHSSRGEQQVLPPFEGNAICGTRLWAVVNLAIDRLGSAAGK